MSGFKCHRSSWGDSECQETSWGACCERRMVFLLRQGLMDQITFGHGVLQACVHKSSWSPTCGWYWALVRDSSGLPCENFVDHMGSCVGPAPGKITWILCGACTWWDHTGPCVGPIPGEITWDLVWGLYLVRSHGSCVGPAPGEITQDLVWGLYLVRSHGTLCGACTW